MKLVKRLLEKTKATDSLEMKITNFCQAIVTYHTLWQEELWQKFCWAELLAHLNIVGSMLLDQPLSAKAEMKVGSTPLKNFEEAQEILVQSHHSDTISKCRRAKIFIRLGPLTHKISIDDQLRVTQVNHLLPASSLPSPQQEDEATEYEQSMKMNLRAWLVQLKLKHSEVHLSEVLCHQRVD